jgi:hypothetical protein
MEMIQHQITEVVARKRHLSRKSEKVIGQADSLSSFLHFATSFSHAPPLGSSIATVRERLQRTDAAASDIFIVEIYNWCARQESNRRPRP